MSRNISPATAGKVNSVGTIDEHATAFDPSRINVFLDIAENDLIPKLSKYININGGVLP